MRNIINFFEIPSTDFDRAVQFYRAVLNIHLHQEQVMGVQSAIFPGDGENVVNGAVVHHPNYEPSDKGCVIYLNVSHEMEAVLARIEPAGGQILMVPTDIGFGRIAFFRDTEGNKIGLHTED